MTNALPKGGMPPLDLLRERRRELGVEPLSGLVAQRPALWRRGWLTAGLVLGASVGLGVLLLLWHQMIKARMGQLERYEAEVEQLKQTLAGHQGALKKLRKSNEHLVKRLSDVRSTSALLADLQLRVPEGVQITEVAMPDTNQIQLKGLARDPVPFGRVNAMELVLRNSPLFNAKSVTLVQAKREPARLVEPKQGMGTKPGEPNAKLELPSAVTFEMTAELTPLAANRLVAVLDGLGAEGMVRRLELLEREGLLK